MRKKTASRIASLEDAPADAALIRQVVASAGFECVSFSESRRLLLALRDAGFDLLLLDWQMPDLSGREVLAWVRTHLDRRIPVMFLSCRDAEHDIVSALAAGADDYMVKPIRPAELAARIDCLLRRAYPAQASPHAPLRLGDYAFDCALRRVTCNGQPIGLTPKEFDLAVLLFRHEGRIVTRDHITAAVWGREISPMSRTIDTHVSRVRSKLGLQAEHGMRLTPVYTHGYRLERLAHAERAAA
ncbi:putative RESPONSE REGULATOR [Cupriavidus taiwanensis]|uniref:RESPONSE REGULATOR n=1 Tax=Cupriavidus taiwanensis TaxID=164546 RepID=A0A976AUF1_9BURK|nr:response regulator transcription factor [Cupriavidus taiwanensis]SOZ51370.1 putative RESPONSE REGULATOR [Cupriavidus taiwanensis]SOZ53257.1 putative RESPONSE REGULATOR [Cupriavidus taiwanensis]SOZ55041.1 putative RESPONSE REGULATOR [Cupriavidus taiwanensis]SPA05386.1 putative RESPONSE REGULATOR [Cupriavidus taiwanensis]